MKSGLAMVRFDDVILTGRSGQMIHALINRDHGFLRYMRFQGDVGFTSRNPAYAGPPDASVEYQLSNGRVERYPAAWALPTEIVRKALHYFFLHEQRAPFVHWHDDSAAAPS